MPIRRKDPVEQPAPQSAAADEAAPRHKGAGADPATQPKPGARGQQKAGPNWTEDGDYIVGKNRPPPASRWRPGQSGNPKGSRGRKETRNVDEQVAAFMEKHITIKTSRGDEKMTHAAALIRKLFEKAIKGDMKATQLLLDKMTAAIERRGKGAETRQDALDPAEDALLQAMLSALRPALKAGGEA